MQDLNNNLKFGSFPLFIFLFFTVNIWLCEVADFICFYDDVKQGTIISRLIILFLLGVVYYFYRNRLSMGKIETSKSYWIFLLIIFSFGMYKSVLPDTSYDILYARIFLQLPGFMDNVGYNYYPVSNALFVFKFPDRFFYLFRTILGFRMGTVLNSLIAILIFTQITQLIRTLYIDQINKIILKKKNNFFFKGILNVNFLAFSIMMCYELVMEFGTYMVDLIGIPFFLEAIRIVLKKQKSSLAESIYFAFLLGMLFAVKLTFLVFIIPLLFLFVVENRSELLSKRLIYCIIAGLLPISIYLIYAFSLTENPVFPFYNAVFNSGYGISGNFKDTRWGPQSIWELIIWPLYIVFKPEYRLSEIPATYTVAVLIGYLSMAWNVINAIATQKKGFGKNGYIVFTIMVSLYLWAATTGHTRYFIPGFILLGMLSISFTLELLNLNKKLSSTVAVICILLVTAQSIVAIKLDAEGKEWSWRRGITQDYIGYMSSLKYIFRDHEFYDRYKEEKIDAFIIYGYSSVASLINKNVPIANMEYINRLNGDEGNKYKVITNHVNTWFDEELNVYTVMKPDEKETFMTYLNGNGYGINDTERISSYLGEFDLCKIERLTE